MNKVWFSALLATLASGSSMATPVYHPPGPNLIYGAISNNQSIMSEVTNPAAGASALLEEKSRYRFGILSSIGFGYEFGNVTDLYNEIDSTTTTLVDQQSASLETWVNDPANIDTTQYLLDASYRSQIHDNIANLINTGTIDPLNQLQRKIDEDGYFKGFASGHVPLMPFVVSHRGLGGSFTLDANVTVAGFLDYLAADIPQLNGSYLETNADLQNVLTNYINGTSTNATVLYDMLASDSTLLVKGAYVTELSLGYSWIAMNHALGNLFTGVRAKYYQAKLTQYAQRLSDLSSSQNSKDTFNNQKGDNYETSTALGLDFGALWVADHYRAGATIDNINKPSFKYPTLALTDSLGNMNYDTSGTVYNDLRKGSTYEMKPQLRLEGALFTRNTNWVTGAALDVNAVEDPFGQEYQWATLSAAYAASKFYIPSVRVGYRANLAGSKQDYIGMGFTWLTINFDVAYGLDEITYTENNKQKKAPRSAMFNIGWAMTF